MAGSLKTGLLLARYSLKKLVFSIGYNVGFEALSVSTAGLICKGGEIGKRSLIVKRSNG